MLGHHIWTHTPISTCPGAATPSTTHPAHSGIPYHYSSTLHHHADVNHGCCLCPLFAIARSTWQGRAVRLHVLVPGRPAELRQHDKPSFLVPCQRHSRRCHTRYNREREDVVGHHCALHAHQQVGSQHHPLALVRLCLWLSFLEQWLTSPTAPHAHIIDRSHPLKALLHVAGSARMNTVSLSLYRRHPARTPRA